MKIVAVNCTKKKVQITCARKKKKKSMTLPPAGHVCCRLSHTKESHDTEGGVDEQNNGRIAHLMED